MSDMVGKVRCDADGCGWITPGPVILREWFGKKCPRCGAEVTNAFDRLVVGLSEWAMKMGLVKQGDGPEHRFKIDTDRRPSRDET